MGWRFWRRDDPAEQRPLPDGVGLGGPSPAGARGRAADDEGEHPPARSAGSRPGGAAPDDLVAASLTEPLAPAPPVDGAFARQCTDLVVALVEAVAAGDPARSTPALRDLTALVNSAPLDDQGFAVMVALAPLSERLPLLSGVTASPHDDLGAASELVAYADLLAARSEPRRGLVPPVTRDLVRFMAHFGCGLPDRDPALAHLMGAAPAEQVAATCLLLAQTTLDGAPDAQALRSEVARLLPG